MSSDRARVSYDASRQYRSVVVQQGRVTLEADGNEQEYIADETLREETIDIVGPCGTPDDGFAVGAGLTFPDIAVGPGTMYVGGLRMVEAQKVYYAGQTEWLDTAGDPLWLDPQQAGRSSEFVYLFLREQEVGAVEDVPLREVALGGPDSAQRSRLIQRIVRLPVNTDTCASALDMAQQKWNGLGLTFDPATMQMQSPARLQVKFVQAPQAETQCDPQVKGGYLGADNQLIRVQIVGTDPATGAWQLVWGYNNASFFHRATVTTDGLTLQLAASPIDSYHAPRINKAIEVLRSAVKLDGHDNWVAAHSGVVLTPTQGYVPETRQQALPTALPPEYIGTVAPLFVRLWEEELTFTPGVPLTLTGTGLQVTITLNGPAGALTAGQFWMFAARPSTPVIIYPQRYFDGPQPPEGPRMWACPLAVVGWDSQGFRLLNDCRETFDNLVELTKRRSQCCSVVVKPEDVGGGSGLQALIDSLAGTKSTISLLPGTYELPATIELKSKHSGLTIEGCHDGAVLMAKAGLESKFLNGLVEMVQANDVTLRRLRFHLPLCKIGSKQLPPVSNNDGTATHAVGVETDYSAIGIRAVHCADLCVEECLFRFTVMPNSVVMAAGIRLASECWNAEIERNRFLHDVDYKRGTHTLIGIMATLESVSYRAGIARTAANYVPVLLEGVRIDCNEFGGLTFAVAVRAEIGKLRCENNRAHGCDGGYYFLSTDLQGFRERLLDAMAQRTESAAHEKLYTTLLQSANIGLTSTMLNMAKAAPLPAGYVAKKPVIVGKSASPAFSKEIRAKARQSNALALQFSASADAKAPAGAPNAGAAAAAKSAGKTEAAIKGATTEKSDIQAMRNSLGYFMVAPATEAEVVPHIPAIRFSGNDVEIIPGVPDKGELHLALVIEVGMLEGASVVATANDIRGQSVGPLARIEGPYTAAITGNLFLNANPQGVSLTFDPYDENAMANISGNCFRANYMITPSTPTGAGCTISDWQMLNSWKDI